MLSMNIVMTQILVILLYVLIGFAAGKFGVILPEQRKYLTKICTSLILPFTILSASSLEIERGNMPMLLMITAILLAVFALSTLTSLKILPAEPPVKITVASLVTYPNCTFLGLPLCRALFGDIAILYNALALLAFNILFFTLQHNLFTGQKFRMRNLVTPGTVATGLLVLMLVLGVHFPSPVQTVISNTGAMITPLSLIIVGVMMSENRLSAIFREKKAYGVTLVRNLVIPILFMLAIRLLPVSPEDKLCLTVYMACPCATLTTIYAIQNDMEPELAAHGVLMSTILFSCTLPLIITLGSRVF